MNLKNSFFKLYYSFQKKGIKGVYLAIKFYFIQSEYINKINFQYQDWLKEHYPSKSKIISQQKTSRSFKYRPKISIITPVYNTPEKWLRLCIESVIKQSYDNWELCLADDNSTCPDIKNIINEYTQKDSRIKSVFRSQNGHISTASNSALEITTGDFIALLDHDDELTPHALYKVVELLNYHPEADLIYSDEDKLEMNGKHCDPSFKPDWSYDYFLSTNYLCHLTVIRKTLIDKVKGFTKGLEGSQDYDLFLRIIEKTKNIFHIPDILYHWRKIPGSTASVYSIKDYANAASLKALNNHLKRNLIKAKASNGLKQGTFRVIYEISNNPLISIIIPTKDKIKYLERCVQSIIQKSSYQNYEILIVDTGSTDKNTFDYYEQIKNNPQVKLLNWTGEFNYSTVNNFGAKNSNGDYLIFLNNDTEIITPDWMESLLQIAQRKDVGTVGCKLLYPIKTIQHSGVFLGVGGIANSNFYQLPDEIGQSFPLLNSKDIIRNYIAVTGACLMVKKDKFLLINGFDPKFKIAYNDIDLCLRLNKAGFKTTYTPFAILYHYESVSISSNRDEFQFKYEQELMIKKWGSLIENDPYCNPNLKYLLLLNKSVSSKS